MKEHTFWIISSLTIDEIKLQILNDGSCALRFAHSEENAQQKLSEMACFCRAYRVVIYEPFSELINNESEPSTQG